VPGGDYSDSELAELAVEWIECNLGFVQAVVRGAPGNDFGNEVAARLVLRASFGGGLTRALRAHVSEAKPVKDPAALLASYARWMLGECRSQLRRQRERDAGTREALTAAALTDTQAAEEAADPYLLVQKALEAGEQPCAEADRDVAQDVATYLCRHVDDILKVFSQHAPAAAVRWIAELGEEDRHCVLLGVFPLRMRHRALTVYRQVIWQGHQRAISVGATQKRVWRLAQHLSQVWPEPRPAVLESAGGQPPGRRTRA
jgi:hypothetical protein